MVQAGKISPELSDFLFAASTHAPEPSQMILAVALAQYPVHVYTLFALRKSNEAYLSGDSENQWGFGQVVALVLVASVLLECFRAIIEYVLIKGKRQHLGASGYKETSLLLFRTLLLDQEGEKGSSAPKEHPTRLRRQRSLPANMKYQ
ncbi:hypothetical protein F4823DRAFT_567678 [Ustulina deusta]|nr:hypothetical protein F4823DRAFT_567678 [Ustulina deusta]